MCLPDPLLRPASLCCSILKVLCQDIRLSENFDFSALSRSTPGYVGADLSSLVQEAAMSAVSRILNSLQDNTNRGATLLWCSYSLRAVGDLRSGVALKI